MSKYIPVLSIAILFFFSLSSHAINATGINGENANTNTNVEIITVTGSRPLDFFRKQLRESEQAFYYSLNDMTDEDEFKIECDIKKNSFSKVASRVCQPKYIELIKYELNQDALQRGSARKGIQDKIKNLPSRRMLERKIAKKRKEHLANVKTLVEQSPELQLKLLNLNKAKHSLEKKKKEVFGERWVSQEATQYMAQTKEFVEE